MPNTIDERSINKGKNIKIYQELENLELALRSAEAIGCHVINVRPNDIREEKEHLILGLLWQIIQVSQSNLKPISVYEYMVIDNMMNLDWSIRRDQLDASPRLGALAQ